MTRISTPTDNNDNDTKGPISQAYNAYVAKGKLQHDVDQLALAGKLDQLYTALINNKRALQPRSMTLQAITDVQPRRPLQRLFHAWRQWMFQQSQSATPPPRGLYIYGSVGVGKSFLMDLFYRTLTMQQSSSLSSFQSLHRRAHFHEFMLDVHERIHTAKQQTPKADVLPAVALELAQQAQVLCFDEFQVTDIADAMILQRLFGMLWRAGVVVVATSNRAPQHLYEGGINRSRFLPFIDLLQQRMHVVHMAGQQDYRRMPQRFTGNGHGRADNDSSSLIDPPYFLWPAESNDTRQALQGIFKKFAQHHNAQEESVPVMMGRTIRVSRSVGPVAWLDFAELCEQPLGAADFLALCQRYPVLVVDHVPQLDANTFNEARRFVTLIDAVYECKTRLILATAVPVDRLFLHFDAQVETNDGDEEIAVTGLSESVVTDQGGASSSHATTMIQDKDGSQVEWSATGRIGVSLAQLSAVRDVAFSFARAESRLAEMSRPAWGRE